MELRSIIICLALIFGKLTVNAQPASFYKVFSGNGYDIGEGVTQLMDSSYLITGTSSSFEDAPSQAFLLNIDKNGEFLWSKGYGGAEFEEGKRVFSVDGFGHYVVGTSTSGPSNSFDGYVVFTNTTGDLQWEKYKDEGLWERVHGAEMLIDTSIVIVGESDSTNSGESDLFMYRVDKLGDVIWSKKWGTDGPDYLSGIVKISDTTFVVCGTKYVADSLENKSYLAKFHNNGTLIWDTVYGNLGRAEFINVYYYNGEIMALGKTIPTGSQNIGTHRVSVSIDGILNYYEDFTPAGNDVYLTGTTQYAATPGKFFTTLQQVNSGVPTYAEGEDNFVCRYGYGFSWDGYGVNYSGTGQDQTNQIIATKDGYAIMVGFHTTIGSGGNSIFVVKIGDEYVFPATTSNLVIYSLVDVMENTPTIDCSAFPNPFSDAIQVNLPSDLSCSLELFDQQGRLLKRIVQNQQSLTIETSDLPQGSYVLRVMAENMGTAVIKLIK